eukprot:IDg17060t1
MRRLANLTHPDRSLAISNRYNNHIARTEVRALNAAMPASTTYARTGASHYGARSGARPLRGCCTLHAAAAEHAPLACTPPQPVGARAVHTALPMYSTDSSSRRRTRES